MNRFKFILLTAIILFVTAESFAQQSDYIPFKGRLINSAGEPVPWASVFIQGTPLGVASNEQGQFEFPIPLQYYRDSIAVRALGYETLHLAVSQIKPVGPQVITLKEKPVVLNEVVVTAPDPEAELRLALQKWDQNFQTGKYEFRSFYRSTQKEHGKYARLLEYALKGVDNGYDKSGQTCVGLEYMGERLSHDYRDPRTQWLKAFFKPQFIFTIENQSRREKELEHDLKEGDYRVSLDSTFLFDDDLVYVISATSLDAVGKFIFDVRFYVRESDHAFIRMDFDGKRKIQYLKPTGIKGNLALDITEYRATYIFKEWEGKEYMYYLNVYAAYNWTGKDTFIQQEENSEAIVQDIQLVKKSPIKPFNRLAYALPTVPYDPDFWNHYDLQSQIPFDPRVRKDLEKNNTLEEQFSE